MIKELSQAESYLKENEVVIVFPSRESFEGFSEFRDGQRLSYKEVKKLPITPTTYKGMKLMYIEGGIESLSKYVDATL